MTTRVSGHGPRSTASRGRRWPALALLPLAALLVGAATAGLDRFWFGGTEEDQDHRRAPVDLGAGPGRPAPQTARALRQRPGATPAATADAHLAGSFGPAFSWPIIPIHTVLMADGRVLSFGADTAGEQTGLLYYAVWDPALGTGPESHLVLDNTTATDTFCAGQALLPGSGSVLLVGGDKTIDGKRNFGVSDVNLFTPADNVLTRQAQSMAYARWYGTIVTNAQGEQVVMGGRIDKSMPRWDPPLPATFASTPEVYTPGVGWRTLTNADSPAAYGKAYDNWSYPHAWLAPDGRVAIITNDGRLFSLDSNGIGKLRKLTGTLPISKQFNSAAMFAPGKVISLRTGGLASVVDFNTNPPTISATAPMSQNRFYGSATVLADGKVWANGGSSKGNKLEGAAYHSELWDPATGQWTTTASAVKPRLYHSISMLMPDATVLTAGGGAPGPVINLNAEIYYPPYLYQPDGQPAPRPVISAAPQAGTWGQAVPVTMASDAPVSKVSLLRFGGVTHAFANDPRYESLAFTQAGAELSVTLPASPNTAPPGFYMLFVLDAAGVPSVAKVIRLDSGL